MSSEHFEHLATPCGCIAEHEASQEPDEAVAEVRRADAARMKRAWRCPDLKEFAPPDEDTTFPAEPLSQDPADVDDHRTALDAVKQVQTMTGVRCATCPWWYTARPWVIQAGRAAALLSDGAAVLVDDNATAPLIEAVHLIRASQGAERSYSDRKRKENG